MCSSRKPKYKLETQNLVRGEIHRIVSLRKKLTPLVTHLCLLDDATFNTIDTSKRTRHFLYILTQKLSSFILSYFIYDYDQTLVQQNMLHNSKVKNSAIWHRNCRSHNYVFNKEIIHAKFNKMELL